MMPTFHDSGDRAHVQYGCAARLGGNAAEAGAAEARGTVGRPAIFMHVLTGAVKTSKLESWYDTVLCGTLVECHKPVSFSYQDYHLD